MAQDAFAIETTDRHIYWAEREDGLVTIRRRAKDAPDSEVLARWTPDTLRNLLLWAEDEKSVTFSITGPLAYQVKQMSRELSLTPEMFVWHAVKVFIETGSQT